MINANELLDFIRSNNNIIQIKVIPKSSENKIIFENENNLIKVKVREIPENGKANVAIIDLFHKNLKIPKSNIEIISGHTNSIKKIKFNL